MATEQRDSFMSGLDELDESVSAPIDLATEDKAISDPVASFLEKHGHGFTRDHKGQLVTYYEAMKCPAMADLINNLGEGVLAITAAIHPEEAQEDEESVAAEDVEQLENEETELNKGKDNSEAKSLFELDNPKKAEPAPAKPEPANQEPAPVKAEASALPVAENSGETYEFPADRLVTDKRVQPVTSSADATPSPQQAAVAAPLTIGAPKESATAAAVEAGLNSAGERSMSESEEINHAEIIPTVTETAEAPPLESVAAQTEMEEIKPRNNAEAPDEQILNTGSELEKEIEYNFPIPDEKDVEQEASSSIELEDIGADVPIDSEEENVPYDFGEDFPIPRGREEKPLFVLPQQFETFSVNLSVPVEEVEETINQLSEKLEVLEPKESAAINQILDKIVELPKQLETPAEGEPFDEKEVRQELENLFAELFDRLGIEYSSELLSAFATLTLNNQLEEVLRVKEGDELVYKIPTDKGTHEFITKLLIGFAKLKKVLLHAYLIGKSAVHHALKPDLNLQPV